MGSIEVQNQARPRAKRLLRSRAAVSALFVAGLVAASAGPAAASSADSKVKLDDQTAHVMKADKCAKDAAKGKKPKKDCAAQGDDDGDNGGNPSTQPQADAVETPAPVAIVVPTQAPATPAPATQVLGTSVEAPAAPKAAAPKAVAPAATAIKATRTALPFTGGESTTLAMLAAGLLSLGAGFKLFGKRERNTSAN